MAVILDASAITTIALEDEPGAASVEDAIQSGHCYITISSLIEAACAITNVAGIRLAEQWIGWLYTAGRITILEQSQKGRVYTEEDFVLLTSEAFAGSGLTPAAASAAAAARRLNIPVLTDRQNFKHLEEAGFCQVQWIR